MVRRSSLAAFLLVLFAAVLSCVFTSAQAQSVPSDGVPQTTVTGYCAFDGNSGRCIGPFESDPGAACSAYQAQQQAGGSQWTYSYNGTGCAAKDQNGH